MATCENRSRLRRPSSSGTVWESATQAHQGGNLYAIRTANPLRLVVLISGGGTTLRNLIEKIAAGQLDARIALVISSNGAAGGLQFAREAGIPAQAIERRAFDSNEAFSEAIFAACRSVAPDLIVMGGFLKLIVIPDDFENRVVNIHPALIPAFCGQGFYGRRVHEAVLEYGAKLSGCTVHFVEQSLRSWADSFAAGRAGARRRHARGARRARVSGGMRGLSRGAEIDRPRARAGGRPRRADLATAAPIRHAITDSMRSGSADSLASASG